MKGGGVIAHLAQYHMASIEARYELAKAWGKVCEIARSPEGLAHPETGEAGLKLSELMQRVRIEHLDNVANEKFENERRSSRLNEEMVIDDKRLNKCRIVTFGEHSVKKPRLKSIIKAR